MPSNLDFLIKACSNQYGFTAIFFGLAIPVLIFLVKIESSFFKYFFLDKKTKEELAEKYRNAVLIDLSLTEHKLLESLLKSRNKNYKVNQNDILELNELADNFFRNVLDICDAILRGHARTSSNNMKIIKNIMKRKFDYKSNLMCDIHSALREIYKNKKLKYSGEFYPQDYESLFKVYVLHCVPMHKQLLNAFTFSVFKTRILTC